MSYLSVMIHTVICMVTHELHIDLETFSEVDLGKSGVYPYTEHPSFKILLFAYAIDQDPVQVLDLANGDCIPDDIINAIRDPKVRKIAHNASFEIACLRRHFRDAYPDIIQPEQWYDTMAEARRQGLPSSLKDLSKVLELRHGKLETGTSLINWFCKPTRGGIHTKQTHRAKWDLFVEYNKQDVEAERELYQRLQEFNRQYSIKPNETENQIWLLNLKINDRGVMVDQDLVKSAIALDEKITEQTLLELKEGTGLENPKSNIQFKKYLNNHGYSVDTLTKESIPELLTQVTDPDVSRMIRLKMRVSKASVAKYRAIERCMTKDGRIHGLFEYYGAGRTGRFAGRLVQLQNLARNTIGGHDMDLLRNLIKKQDDDAIDLLYGEIPDMLSQAVRTALIAKPGHEFIVADYSAIEARVTAWLAGEKWREHLFKQGGDIYCESASQMFHVPVVKHGINGELRQKGKVAELACGYGGGVGALKAMGGEKMGLTEEEMTEIIRKWRLASPKICALWRQIEGAWREVLDDEPESARIIELPHTKLRVTRIDPHLSIALPNGRVLIYRDVKIDPDEQILFMGQNQITRKWCEIKTWGGKLIENIVQAIARDILAYAMLRLEKAGYKIVAHIHDEVIIEHPKGFSEIEEVYRIMCENEPWMNGLRLDAAGYFTSYYLKD